ncbi:MAG: TMEM165/GDT1 family protein [Rhodospirillales bacterium]
MDAFLVSTGVVALGEIGDKTQLLAVLLAARFRQPVPVILGILAATLQNHALAGFVGTLAADFLAGPWLHWIVGGTFLAVAAWALVPDTIDDSDANRTLGAAGAFLATSVAFFFAEFGDKTQVATVTLAARFGDLIPVVAGTTLGMLIADVPAVYLGERFAGRLPVATIRYAAAALFAVLGIATLAGFGF